jgi:hypothetical protein
MLFLVTSWLLVKGTEENKVKTHLAYIVIFWWLIDWTASNRIKGDIFISFCDHTLTFYFTENRIIHVYPSWSPILLDFVILHDIRFVVYSFLFLQRLVCLFPSSCTFCMIYNCILLFYVYDLLYYFTIFTYYFKLSSSLFHSIDPYIEDVETVTTFVSAFISLTVLIFVPNSDIKIQ